MRLHSTDEIATMTREIILELAEGYYTYKPVQGLRWTKLHHWIYANQVKEKSLSAGGPKSDLMATSD